jgi:uncharacterized protein YacL (UPF0231 family)
MQQLNDHTKLIGKAKVRMMMDEEERMVRTAQLKYNLSNVITINSNDESTLRVFSRNDVVTAKSSFKNYDPEFK